MATIWTVRNGTLNQYSQAWQYSNFRTWWQPSLPATRIRFYFPAISGKDFRINGASVGERSGSTSAFTATPTRITFGGSSTALITAATYPGGLWSDWIDIAIDSAKQYLVHIYQRYPGSSFVYIPIHTETGGSQYQNGVNDADYTLTLNPTLNLSNTTWSYGVLQIESAADPQDISPSGIASEEAFGTPTVVPDQTVSPTGIPSEEAFGTPTLSQHVVYIYEGTISVTQAPASIIEFYNPYLYIYEGNILVTQKPYGRHSDTIYGMGPDLIYYDNGEILALPYIVSIEDFRVTRYFFSYRFYSQYVFTYNGNIPLHQIPTALYSFIEKYGFTYVGTIQVTQTPIDSFMITGLPWGAPPNLYYWDGDWYQMFYDPAGWGGNHGYIIVPCYKFITRIFSYDGDIHTHIDLLSTYNNVYNYHGLINTTMIPISEYFNTVFVYEYSGINVNMRPVSEFYLWIIETLLTKGNRWLAAEPDGSDLLDEARKWLAAEEVKETHLKREDYDD